MANPFFSRRSARKQNYNYSLPGHYFVTIVVHDKAKLLGHIQDGVIVPSKTGEVVQQSWFQLSSQHTSVTSEAFVLMPNHVHGIIKIHPNNKSISLGAVVRSFKARSTNEIRHQGLITFEWQRNYHDRIIRTERELKLVQLYIATNPLLWRFDPENKSAELNETASENMHVFKQCGFSEEDIELIRNYVEYRKLRS